MASITRLAYNIVSTFSNKGIKEAEKDFRNFEKSVKKSADLIGAAAGIMAGLWVAETVRMGAEANTQSQLIRSSFESLMGSGEQAVAFMGELRDEFEDSTMGALAFQKAAQTMMGFGVAVEDVLPRLKLVENTMAALGVADQDAFNGTVRALSQIEAKGRVYQEELQQLAEHGVPAVLLVSEAMGKSQAEVRQMIEDGTIEVSEFFDLLAEGSTLKFGDAADNIKTTWTGTMAAIRAANERVGMEIMEPFIDPFEGGAFVTVGQEVVVFLKTLADELDAVDYSVDRLESGMVSIVKGMTNAIDDGGLKRFIFGLEEINEVVAPFIAFVGTRKVLSFFKDFSFGIGSATAAMSPWLSAVVAFMAVSEDFQDSIINLARQFASFVGPATETASALANQLAPMADIVTAALTGLVDMVEKAIGLTKALFESMDTGNWQQVAVGAVTALGIIGFAMAEFGGIAATRKKSVDSMRKALEKFSGLSRGKKFLIITGLIAGVGAAIDAVIRDSVDPLNDRVRELDDAFRQFDSGHIVGEIEGLSEAFDQMVKDVDFSEFLESGEIGTSLKEIFSSEGAIGGIERMWSELGGAITKVLQRDLAGAAREVMDGLADDIVERENVIRDAFSNIIDDFEAMALATDGSAEATKNLEDNLRDYLKELKLEEDQINEIVDVVLPELEDELETAAKSYQELEDATNESTAAMINQWDQIKAQKDPYFAVIKSMQDVTEAQDALDEALKDSESTIGDIADAEGELVDANINLLSNLKELGGEIGEGLPADVEALLLALGASEETIDFWNQLLIDAAESAEELAGDYEINLEANDEASKKIEELEEKYRNVPETLETTFTVVDDASKATEELEEKYRNIPETLETVIQADDQTAGPVFSAEKRIKDLPDHHTTNINARNRTLSPVNEANRNLRKVHARTVNINARNKVWAAVRAAQAALKKVGDRWVTIHATFSQSDKRAMRKLGLMADGGPVIGPGTGTSDDVPLMASNGEYVLTAETVRNAGGFSAVDGMVEAINSGTSTAAKAVVSGVGSKGAYVINFNGPVTSKRQAEDMVVSALNEARRKGRIR